jgi:MOSC domain-containing protein YiiM
MARLLSVNVGLPRDIAWRGRTVHTGIWKNPVLGRCRAGRLNLAGDGQGDLGGHGTDSSARTSRSRACPTIPFASATVIKSAAPCSRSLNLA